MSNSQKSDVIKVKTGGSTASAGKMSVMDKLMEGVSSFSGALKRNQKVEGTVTAISKKMVLIDIGAKTEGVVSGEDLAEAYDVLKELKVGEKVSAYVKFPENDQGQIILTLKQAADENRWYKFKKLMDEEKEVEVSGLEVNKGGMVVKVGDIRGFVPTSQFGEKLLGNMESLLNKNFKVRVIEVDKDQNRLIFSEKLVSDSEALAKKGEGKLTLSIKQMTGDPWSSIETNFAIGTKHSGKVVRIAPYGIFVNFDKGVDGLIHVSKKPADKEFKVGDKVEVFVENLDVKARRMSLGVVLTEVPVAYK